MINRFLQVDKQGRNTCIKRFLDLLGKRSVECVLYIDTNNVDEVTFTIKTRRTSRDTQILRKALKTCFGESK